MSNQASGDQAEMAQTIRNDLGDDILDEAEDVGIDVDDVIGRQIEKYDSYGVKTVENFVESVLRQQIEAERAEVLQGILMGSRDRYGKNWPRRHSLVKSDFEHLEVSTWDGTLPDGTGNEIPIPKGGAKVQIRCDYDSDYDSYQATQLDSVDEVPHDDLVEMLSQVALDPSELSRGHEHEVVVVRGEIGWGDAQTVFEGGEPQGDGRVLIEDERGELQPHMEVGMRSDDTTVRGHIERQRYGRPYFQVEDFQKLLLDAYEDDEMFESPEAEAEFVSNGIRGREVIIVGNVNSVDKSRDDDGNVNHYVDIALTAMVDVDADVGDGGEQSDLADVGDREASETEGDGDDGSTEPSEGEDESPDNAQIDDVKAKLEQYAELTQEDLSSLSVGDVQEKVSGISAPESVIKVALDDLSGEGDESGDGEESESDDSPMTLGDEYDELVEAGMYQCPGDGGNCPGKGSTFPELIADHIIVEHEPESATEARDWIDERI